MSNLDKRLSALEQKRQPSAGLDVRRMTDAQLYAILREHNPAYRDMSNDEIMDSILRNYNELTATHNPTAYRVNKLLNTARERRDNHHGL